MAGEFQIAYFETGISIDRKIFDANGQVWDGTDFVDYATADLADYVAAMTEQGTASKFYLGTAPGIPDGDYLIIFTKRAGGSAAETDELIGQQTYKKGLQTVLIDDSVVFEATISEDGVNAIATAVKDEVRDLMDESAIQGSVNDASATTTGFVGDSGLSSTNDFYNGSVLVFTSGTLKGLARKVSDYVGSTKTFTLSSALPSAPANGVTFFIVGRIE